LFSFLVAALSVIAEVSNSAAKTEYSNNDFIIYFLLLPPLLWREENPALAGLG